MSEEEKKAIEQLRKVIKSEKITKLEKEIERLRTREEADKGIYYFAHKQIVEELYVSKDKILQYLKDHEEGMTGEDVYELKQMIEGE